MPTNRIILNNLSKRFNGRIVFSNLSLKVENDSVLAVSGRNGRGKSTLLKIITGILEPTSGQTEYQVNDIPQKFELIRTKIGFTAPYINFYEEFSAIENLRLLSRIRQNNFNLVNAEDLLKKFGLLKRKNDHLKTYSSGMIQRVKLIYTFLDNPLFICLDEPSTNLDSEGKKVLWELVEERKKDAVIIIASNEDEELSKSDKMINIEDYI